MESRQRAGRYGAATLNVAQDRVVALETLAEPADTNPVIPRLKTVPPVTVIDAQFGKLAACDESLAVIASDVEGLLDELAVLRAAMDDLLQRHAEHEALLTEKEQTLSKLDSERSQACRRADESAAALRDLEASLTGRDERVRSLERELRELRGTLAERDHQLSAHRDEHERILAALAEREAALRDDRAVMELTYADGDAGSRPAGSRDGAVTEPAPLDLAARLDQGMSDTYPRASAAGHLRFAPFPEGYRLIASDERCSRPGDLIEVDGRRFSVTRVGRSPLPHDERQCAFLLPDAAPR